jgi:hypothetical protein
MDTTVLTNATLTAGHEGIVTPKPLRLGFRTLINIMVDSIGFLET